MQWIKTYYTTFFLLVLAFAFFTRLWNVHTPPEYYFDEVYHAATAKLIAHNNPQAYEWWNPPPEPNTAIDWLHPPLAKYTQALSILLFGENALGWRFSSVLFGTGVVALTMLLTLRLFRSAALSLLAGALASFDGLLLTMSRIAMNDIHVTFFILLSVLLYTYVHPDWYATTAQKKRPHLSLKFLIPTALAAGLAVASKWSGVFVIGLLLGFEALLAISCTVLATKEWKHSAQQFVTVAVFCIGIPIVVYIAGYSHAFIQGKDWKHLVELHKQIWWYQTHLEATHPYQSQPWQWFLDLRPVWMYVEYTSNTTRSDIYALANPALSWLSILSILYLVWYLVHSTFWPHTHTRTSRAARLTLRTKFAQFLQQPESRSLLLLLFAYAIVWLPWSLSPRIMFFYHFTPAIPFLSIITAWFTWHLWHGRVTALLSLRLQRATAVTLVFLIFATFCVWYPHWTNIPTPLWMKDHLYFALPSWK